MKKNFHVYIDQSAFDQSFIYISAGLREMQIKLASADLMIACKANKAEITQKD